MSRSLLCSIKPCRCPETSRTSTNGCTECITCLYAHAAPHTTIDKSSGAPKTNREVLQDICDWLDRLDQIMVTMCGQLLIDITFTDDNKLQFTYRDKPDSPLPSPLMALRGINLSTRSGASSAHSSVRAHSAASSHGWSMISAVWYVLSFVLCNMICV